MKQQHPSQEEDRKVMKIRREQAKQPLFATVRAIQQDNKDADPQEVL